MKSDQQKNRTIYGVPVIAVAPHWTSQDCSKALCKFNDLGIFYVQLVECPEDNQTQPISVGIDPGKLFSELIVPKELAMFLERPKNKYLSAMLTGNG